MSAPSHGLTEIQRRVDGVMRFLSATLSIADAHTVEFYTRDVWRRFVAATPQEVLAAFGSEGGRQGAPEPGGKGKDARSRNASVRTAV